MNLDLSIHHSGMQTQARLLKHLTLKNVTPKEKLIDIPLELFLEKSPHKIEVTRNFMEEDCKSLLV